MRMRALTIILLMLAMVGNAWAVDCSSNDFTLLNELSFGGDFRPHDVAIGPGGMAYVTDFYNDNVTVFDRAGNIVKFRNITNPHGIAIDDSGNLYIGWANNNDAGHFKGQVDVYDASLNLKGSLGIGYGEFNLPYSIATDETRVYVADNRADLVKVYDKASRQLLVTFGGYGTTDGSLVRPTGIVVHSPGVLFIADNALHSGQGGYAYGAGVHKFTIDDNNTVSFIMKFGTHSYTSGSGVLTSPGGIAVDQAGRVLVSDSTKGNIEVFDVNGGSVCEYQIEAFTMFPRGMDTNAEGKLMVAAHGRIYIYGLLGQYTDMAVNPNKIIIDAEVCGSSTASSSFQVTNNGTGLLDWIAAENVAWMQLSSTSGSLSQGGGENVVVSADTAGLVSGTYRGVIGVTSAGAEEVVTVALNVAPAPALEADVESLSFNVVGNDIPAAHGVNLSMSGGKGWTSNAPAWISMTPAAGDGGALTLAAIGVNSGALDTMAGGEYSGSVTIDAGCDSVDPLVIPVSLTYVKGGSLEVTTNSADASFTISGPETYSGSGTSFRVDGVTEGAYTIIFDAITGFKTPSSGTMTVVNGETAVFHAEYVDLRESNDIIISKGRISHADSNGVVIYDVDGGVTASFDAGSADDRRRDRKGLVTAAGDIDGDGLDEIIAFYENGIIRGLESDGAVLAGSEFSAFPYRVNADVASGDLNGDGLDEIVVGVGDGDGGGRDAAVRVFGYTGSSITDTGIYFLASSGRGGVNVVAGDVDGDGVDELVTAANDSQSRTATVRVWKADASGGNGAWSVVDNGGFTLSSVSSVSDLSAGDVDSDGKAEILVASRGEGDAYIIGIYRADGTSIGSIQVSSANEVYMAAGDTDFDGAADIVLVTSDRRASFVQVYRADGSLVSEFSVFADDNNKEARVSLGRVVAR